MKIPRPNWLTARRLALALSCVAPSGRADVLIGTNGERFSGRVIEETTNAVVFESELGGRLTIPRSRIQEFQRTSPPAPVPEAGLTNLPSPSGTNAVIPSFPTNAILMPPGIGLDKSDWIQLKSGEWLRGRLEYIQDRKLEFDSDELNDQSLDFKDVRQVFPAQPFFTKFDGREPIYGTVVVSSNTVSVVGPEQVTLPRDQLTGITPGGKREIDFWSGSASLGLDVQSGNTKEVSESASAELVRRTPATVILLNYIGNFSEVNGDENANNHRGGGYYDIRLNRNWFVRPVQFEYYRDQLANIDGRGTLGVGVGLYIFDRPNLEWTLSGGPGYQYTRFTAVEAGQSDHTGTPAAVLQTRFKADVTQRLDFKQTFSATVSSQEAGLYTHHAVTSLEFEIKRHLDINVSFVWDYLLDPHTESNGTTPLSSDLRLNLGLGVEF
jgi:putative salt-induced outer membrane protein YdiY